MRPKFKKNQKPTHDDDDVLSANKVERCLGDAMKCVNFHVGTMIEEDGLQHHEVLGLILASLKAHFPDAQEFYADGTQPFGYYGHLDGAKKLIKNLSKA